MKRAILVLAAVALLAPASAWANNSLDVNPTAALQGGFGLEVIFDGGTGNAFVQDNSPNAEGIYNVTFSASRASWDPSSTQQFYVLTGRSSVPNNVLRFYVRENPGSPGNYHTRVIAREDDLGWIQVGCGNFATSTTQSFQVIWKKSTAPGMNNGELTCLRNGAPPPGGNNSNTAVDNDTHTMDEVRFGYYQSFPANATAANSYYLDEFISLRTP